MNAWRLSPVVPCSSTLHKGYATFDGSGDLVIVFQAGAYGLTASPTAFLGHPSPVEILV